MEISKLQKELSTRLVKVTFRKKDGDIRVMTCTKNLDMVPPSSWPVVKEEINKERVSEAIRVYDVNAKGWRSFIPANILEVE